MKLAIAAFGTALALATSASAMIGPYERAVDNGANSALFSTGASVQASVTGHSNSPQGDWNNGEVKSLTKFSTQGSIDTLMQDHYGAGSR